MRATSRRIWLALLMAVGCSSLASAAMATAEIGLPPLQVFAPRDYRGGTQNWDIEQADNGLIYVANNDGVLEYDGQRWRLIQTSNQQRAYGLARAADGRLYVSAVAEVGYLAPAADGELHYVSLLEQIPPAERDFADVFNIMAIGDAVYFRSDERLLRWQGGGFRSWEPQGRFHHGFQVGQRLFVREPGRGLLELVDDELRLVADGERFAEERIYTILPTESAQTVLLGTRQLGLVEFDGEHYKPWPTDSDEALRRDLITSGLRLADGRIVLGTVEGGLYVFDREGRRQWQIDHSQGLPDPGVLALLEDRDGDVWAGMNSGLVRLELSSPLTRFDERRGLPGLVYSVHRQAGQLYAGTLQGLYRMLPGVPARFERVPGVNGPAWVLTNDDETVWIASYLGSFRVEHDQALPMRSNQDPTFALLYHHDGRRQRMWMGLRGRLVARERITDGRWLDEVPVAGIQEEIHAITADSAHRLWLGSWSGGLLRLRLSEQWPTDPQVDIERFGSAHGLPSLSGNRPFRFGDETLFASAAGILCFDEAQQRFLPDPRFRDAFPDGPRYIEAVKTAADGTLWTSTRGSNDGQREPGALQPQPDGRYRWQPQPVAALSGLSIRAIHADPEGEVWWASEQGLYRFDRRGLPSKEAPFNTLLRRVSTRTGRLLFAGAGTAQPASLSYDERHLRFEFAATRFDGPGTLRFQTRIDGLDSEWSDWRMEPQADYSNLLEGGYRFRVRALDRHGRLSAEADFPFRVQPPWFRSWWAYFGYLLLFLASGYGLWRRHERRLHEQLALASLQRINVLKDQFLANTSHELRTPLNGMVGLAQSLLAQHELPASARAPLELIVSSGRRLAALINDILDFAKLKQGSLTLLPRPLALHLLVESVLAIGAPLRGDKPLQLINAVDPGLPPILADEARLQQILVNLVGNAIKFTDAGSVEVGVELDRPGPYKPGPGTRLSIYVRDTGIGIPADKQSSIFEHFEQVDGSTERSHGGTGLGLAVTRQLVKLHGGEIGVRSAPGHGSTFHFTLPQAFDSAPLALAPAAPTAASNATQDDPGNWAQAALEAAERRRPTGGAATDHFQPAWPITAEAGFAVLAVDDESINREVLRGLLADQPIELTLLGDGHAALQQLQQRRFDLILLDVMMPGLSGFDVCRQVRAEHSALALPILLLTAKTRIEDLAEGLAAGANDFLHKPISRIELLSRMNTQLQLAQLSRQALAAHEARLRGERERDQLLVREKLATASQITGGLAHEINNPINFVGLSAQNLEELHAKLAQFLRQLAGEDADAEVLTAFDQRFAALSEQVGNIREGTRRVADIVHDLRTFSKLDPPEPKPTQIAELLAATVRLVGARYRQRIDFELDLQANPPIMCLPARLNQVFMNLVINACHAIQERAEREGGGFRGRLRVTSSLGPAPADPGLRPAASIRATEAVPEATDPVARMQRSEIRDGPAPACEPDHLIISIEDNGGGIAAELRQRIFEPFFTTKPEGVGTGLGLAVSRSIVEEQGGALWLSNRGSPGAQFLVALPVARAEGVKPRPEGTDR